MTIPFKKAFLAVAVLASASVAVAQNTVADLVLPPPPPTAPKANAPTKQSETGADRAADRAGGAAQSTIADLVLPSPPTAPKANATAKPSVIGAERVSGAGLGGERKADSREKEQANTRKRAKEFVAKEALPAVTSENSRSNGYHLVELPIDELNSDPVVKVQRSTAVRAIATKTSPAADPFYGLKGTPVSDSQFNRFTFPEAVLGVYFPEGAPLAECPETLKPQDTCGPIFLNGRRVMLLQLLAGAKGPVQMVVHLHSGRVMDLNLMPVKGPGAVVRVDGAEDGVSDARRSEVARAGSSAQGPANEANVALLSKFARGDIPGGFSPESVVAPTRYQHYDLIPMAKWGDGSDYKVHMLQVVPHSGREVQIDVSMFRTDKVKAVALDRTTIRANQPATLYMLEHAGD